MAGATPPSVNHIVPFRPGIMSAANALDGKPGIVPAVRHLSRSVPPTLPATAAVDLRVGEEKALR